MSRCASGSKGSAVSSRTLSRSLSALSSRCLFNTSVNFSDKSNNKVTVTDPVAHLGGHGAMPPPFGLTMKIFYRRLLWKGAFFAVFQQIPAKNGRICGFYWTFKSKKCFSFRGASPLTPNQGLCPWTPLGAPPPGPHYRLALCALTMAPLCQILNTPLDRPLNNANQRPASEASCDQHYSIMKECKLVVS